MSLSPVQLAIVLLSVGVVFGAQHRVIEIRMPDIRPAHDDSYLCVAKRMNTSQTEFLVGFEPRASAKRLHHLIVYGCSTPGRFRRDTPDYTWDCGEMGLGAPKTVVGGHEFERGPNCGPGAKNVIVFAWALDAPPIELPPKVGFKVGGDTGINYLVLNAHYSSTDVFRANRQLTDASAIQIRTVSGAGHGITRQAGIHLMWSLGRVPMGRSRHKIECTINEDKVIHPFRFRTHTHALGTWVAGHFTSGADSRVTKLIGEKNPQTPQMFYPVADPNMTIRKGDKLSAYCDYNNTRDHVVFIGSTGWDEMCNFYMMYWTEGELMVNQDCFGYNP